MASDKEKELEQEENVEQNQENENNEQAEGLVFNEREHMVILLNNENTAFEAVLDVLCNVFGLNQPVAMDRMQAAHDQGYSICYIHSQATCQEKAIEAEQYCQQRAGMMHPMMNDRSMYYGELQFEVRVRN